MTEITSSPEPRIESVRSASAEIEPSRPEDAQIGWLRALASGLAVIVIGFLGAVVGPNAILTKSLALTRGARELLATALFFAVITILAVALRWLQHRKLI
jgi:hypothetical protein